MPQLRVVTTLLVSLSWASMMHLNAQQNGGPPTEQTINVNLPAGAACRFAINISGQGKTKSIKLPGDRLIITSPGLNATVKNLADTSKEVTLNVTGASHVSTEPDGTFLYTITGRNLNLDPNAGFVLSIGHFSFGLDADGNLTKPLSGMGQLVDICAMID